MKYVSKLLLIGCFLICCGSLTAQVVTPPSSKRPVGKDAITTEKIKLGEDEPGCKDSALMSRIPGCSIIQCDAKEADGLEIQVAALTDGTIQKESMDGTAEIIYYLCPARITLPQIAKLSEASLSKGGFKTVFYGKDGDDFPIITGLKDNQWVQVSTYMYDDNSAYIQTALKVPVETQANSDAMADEMAKTGRVILHGLAFDTDQGITAESEKILTDIDAFLVRQPDLRIRIEGHTDSAGDNRTANMTASQKQASSVASWLLDHGIDKSRISIQGLGDTKPLEEGSSPEVKAKNRRIELVKF
jgi:outer membrane protein OmpA-like peptidoglycan-associated protein